MSDETRKIVLTAEDMKTLLSYTVSEEDTKKYQDVYNKEEASNALDLHTKFQYAWCLTHSKKYNDIKKGASMFEELFKEGSEEVKRDSLFYLALAETKLKNYCTANKYVKAFLSVEPTNVQAQQLDEYVQNQLQKDGIKGMALFGAVSVLGGATAVVLGTLAVGAAVGFALAKKRGNSSDSQQALLSKSQ